MNWKKICLGSFFIMLSGVLFEVDKILSYYFWATNISVMYGSGGYNSKTSDISIWDNPFIIVFLFIGIVLYISAFVTRKKES